MPEVFLPRDEILALLPEAPARLGASTAGVDSGFLRRRPAADEWSPVEILAHMRACDDIYGIPTHERSYVKAIEQIAASATALTRPR